MKQELEPVKVEDHKVTPLILDETYKGAILGAQKIILLGIVAEICKIEQSHGNFTRFVSERCQAPLGTINSARRATKMLFEKIGVHPSMSWSLFLTLPQPHKIFELDEDGLPPRLAGILRKIKEFTAGKTGRALELEVGSRSADPQRNGHAKKRKPKPTGNRVQQLLMVGKGSLTEKLYELLQTDSDTLKDSITEVQRQNIAHRLRLLADKLDG